MATHHFDLVILGSGSTAFAAALRAAEMGKTAAMTESRTLGGTCVNRGCLPSKNLIEAARLVWEAAHPRYPGIEPAPMRFAVDALIAQKDAIVETYRGRKYESIVTETNAIQVFTGQATVRADLSVSVGDDLLVGGNLLVATGTRPRIPALPGLVTVPYLTSDLLGPEADDQLREIPKSLLVLGAGYVALELGQLFHRLGSRVTLVARSPELLHGFEPEVGPTVRAALEAEGITVMTSARVERVSRSGAGVTATVNQAGVKRLLEADRLLAAAGRLPNTEDLGLGGVGVHLDEEGFVVVDEYLRTSNPRIFAAGDVIGGQQGSQLATPVGAHDGGIAAENMFSSELRAVDHTVVPRAIFIDPQVATVGMTDAQVRRAGHRCSCRTVPLTLVPRAEAVHDNKGFVKMVLDAETHRVMGVTMVGREAAEVIHEAAMGLRLQARAEDFVDMLHVYPTMAEALKIVALSFFKDVSKLSCCAE